jgi:hypothetical protein
MLGALFEFERFPVRDTPTGSATDRPQRSIALDVLGSVLGVPFDLDRAELEVDPRSSDAAAQRAIASRGHSGRGRELQFDSAAVAGTLMHESVLSMTRGSAAIARLAKRLRIE